MTSFRRLILPCLATLGLSLLSPLSAQEAKESPASPSGKNPLLYSEEDGWLDVSKFVDHAYGFIPIVIPITEPAVGFGAVGALAFIDKDKDGSTKGMARPNVSSVGGLGTENGTWGAFGADMRYWMDGALQTTTALMTASVNLDYYGMGDDAAQSDPKSYTIAPKGGMLQGRYRFGEGSRFWAGLKYLYASSDISFDVPAGATGLPSFSKTEDVGGLTPSVTFDSRDNMFTPTKGSLLEVAVTCFSSAFGGDAEFQRPKLMALHYVPLNSKWFLGLRGQVDLSYGDVPFYCRPFVMLRGAEAMRYQGEHVAVGEAELRWQCWKRFSLVGFLGTGATWTHLDHYDSENTIVTGGGGFRYELARKYGLHMGVDVGFGPDNPAIYVQFGSAWLHN